MQTIELLPCNCIERAVRTSRGEIENRELAYQAHEAFKYIIGYALADGVRRSLVDWGHLNTARNRVLEYLLGGYIPAYDDTKWQLVPKIANKAIINVFKAAEVDGTFSIGEAWKAMLEAAKHGSTS